MTSEYDVDLGPLGKLRVDENDVEDVDLDEESLTVGGVRVTESEAAAIGREISTRHGRRGGRPPKEASERSSVQKAVRLTPAQAARLAETAETRGVGESQILREALDAFLELQVG